jgi:hypothetical protein
MANESAFIGQFQSGPRERVEVWLRKISGARMLVFTTIDSSGDESRRGNGGLTLEVGQIPHLETMIRNAHARALMDRLQTRWFYDVQES